MPVHLTWLLLEYGKILYLPRHPPLEGVCRMLYFISHIAVPYDEGLSETIKNIGKKYGIQVHFKSGKTLKDELVSPKDKDHLTNKSGIIYRYKYNRLECDEEYIGEIARTFGERLKEHLKAPPLFYDHSNITGHTADINNFSIVGREEQNLSRLIKESMFIRVNNPSLNKNYRQIPSATCMG